MRTDKSKRTLLVLFFVCLVSFGAFAGPLSSNNPEIQTIYTRLEQDEAKYGRRAIKPREIVQRKKEWNETLTMVKKYFQTHTLWNFVHTGKITEGKFNQSDETQDFSADYEFQVDNDAYSLLYEVNKQMHRADIIDGCGIQYFTTDFGGSYGWVENIIYTTGRSPTVFVIKASLVDETGKAASQTTSDKIYLSANNLPVSFARDSLISLYDQGREAVVCVSPFVPVIPEGKKGKIEFKSVKVADLAGDLSLRIDGIEPQFTRDFTGSMAVIKGPLGWSKKIGDWTTVPAVHDTIAAMAYTGRREGICPDEIDGKSVTVLGLSYDVKYAQPIPDTVKAILPSARLVAGSKIGKFADAETLTLPRDIEYIGPNTFQRSGVVEIIFPQDSPNRIVIDYNAFTINKIKKLELPGSVDMLGENAFGPVQSLTLNDGLRYLGRTAFGNEGRWGSELQLPELKRVTIPSTVLYMGLLAFGERLSAVTFKGNSYVISDRNKNPGPFFSTSGSWGPDRTMKITLPDDFDPMTLVWLFNGASNVRDDYEAKGGKACSITFKIGTGVDESEK